MLTRRDFESLASVIRRIDLPLNQHSTIVAAITDWCAGQNPRFDRDRFREAAARAEVSIEDGGTVCPDCDSTDFDRYTGTASLLEAPSYICRGCQSLFDVETSAPFRCPCCKQTLDEEGGCACVQ